MKKQMRPDFSRFVRRLSKLKDPEDLLWTTQQTSRTNSLRNVLISTICFHIQGRPSRRERLSNDANRR